MLWEMMAVAMRVIQFFAIGFIVWTITANGWRHQDPAGVWIAWFIIAGMVLTVARHARRAYVLATLRHRIASRGPGD